MPCLLRLNCFLLVVRTGEVTAFNGEPTGDPHQAPMESHLMIIQVALIKPSESHSKLRVLNLRKIGGVHLDKSWVTVGEGRGRE